MDAIGPITYIATQKLFDDFYPKGLQYYWKSSFLDEISDGVKAAYGPEKYQKLVALKNRYDPANFFRLNQNIKPG